MLSLSPTLSEPNVILSTAKINAYKRVAGEAIFEIGRRLKYVKENDLTHGKFGKWAREEFGFTASMASNYIAAYKQFADLPTSANLSASKILELIALPSDIDRADVHWRN
jgi:hypothetical protein